MQWSMSAPSTRSQRRLAATMVLALALIGLFSAGPAASAAEGGPQAVYVMTNDPAGNAVMMYGRAADGSLAPEGTIATGGAGTGVGLGSQGGLVLSADNRWLYVVNAGSNTISTFQVMPDGLQFIGVYGSQGVRPTSLTVSGKVVYVLNAGGTGNIAGFTVDKGVLAPIPGSVRPLSGGATNPAQIQFNAQGTTLVVTERATNQIVTYPVSAGVAGDATVNPSVGAVPFGFDIDRQDHVVVSEAAGGAEGTGASSYSLGDDGVLTPISQSIGNGQGAACWLVIAKSGHSAYTANAATNNLSTYAIAADGSLTLVQEDVATDMQPLDMDITVNGRFLYVIDGRSDTIRGFAVGADGSLTDIGVQVPTVATAVGMAAS